MHRANTRTNWPHGRHVGGIPQNHRGRRVRRDDRVSGSARGSFQAITEHKAENFFFDVDYLSIW